MKIPIIMLLLCTVAVGQELKPTNEEIQTLAKFKERVLKVQAEQEAIQANTFGLQQALKLKKEELQKVNLELQNAAETVKKAHEKDWGSVENISYNPNDASNGANSQTEGGIFIKTKEESNGNQKEGIKEDGSKKASKEKGKEVTK